jgi:hypothetical protein
VYTQLRVNRVDPSCVGMTKKAFKLKFKQVQYIETSNP